MAGLTDATLALAGAAVAAATTHLSLHTADPGTTGANEVTGGGYARVANTFNVDGDGDLTLPGTKSFVGPAGGAVLFVGLWTASSGGTFRGGYALVGDNVFSAGGQYDVTALTITGTAS